MRFVVVIALGLLLVSAPALAHKPSDAHVQLVISGDRVTGTLAVAVRDLDGALDLDANGDGSITWQETQTAAPRIAAYETERLVVDGCTLKLGAGALVDFSDGAYWTVSIDGTCDGAPDRVTYKLLFDIDAQHRGIVQIVTAHGQTTAVARSAKPIEIPVQSASLVAFAKQGVWHALSVPQHLVVLFCLLLPVCLRRRDQAPRITGAFILGGGVALLVTGTGLLHLPSSIVEVVLALSALAAAGIALLDVADAHWDLAFELGLVQGLGYALWVAELGAPPHLLGPLLGFGIGIAFGQTVVAVVLAGVLGALPKARARQIHWIGAAAAALLAAIWIIQLWS